MAQQQQILLDVCMDILCRLPLPTIIRSKLVCSAWRHMIESPDFSAQFLKNLTSSSTCTQYLLEFLSSSSSHTQKSLEFPPINNPMTLLDCALIPKPSKIVQTQTLERDLSIHVVNMLVVKIDISYIAPLARATVNGLILLAHKFPGRRHQQLLICNPITREFLTIPNPPHHISFNFKFLTTQLRRTPSYGAHENGNYIYGFGVSRRSNEYKLVWDKLWMNTECAFLGGNLYWLDPDMGASRFWCLDLETEVFTAFSAPCQPPQGCVRRLVCVLEERLCLCDVVVVEGGYDEIEMWLMSNEELGDWWKEYEIREGYWMRLHGYLFPIKVLEVGGMLFGRVGEPEILWYSPKYSSFRGASSNSLWLLYPHNWSLVRDASRRDWCPTAAHYTPSFLPLKTLDIRTLFPDMDTIQPCSRRWTTAPYLVRDIYNTLI